MDRRARRARTKVIIVAAVNWLQARDYLKLWYGWGCIFIRISSSSSFLSTFDRQLACSAGKNAMHTAKRAINKQIESGFLRGNTTGPLVRTGFSMDLLIWRMWTGSARDIRRTQPHCRYPNMTHTSIALAASFYFLCFISSQQISHYENDTQQCFV